MIINILLKSSLRTWSSSLNIHYSVSKAATHFGLIHTKIIWHFELPHMLPKYCPDYYNDKPTLYIYEMKTLTTWSGKLFIYSTADTSRQAHFTIIMEYQAKYSLYSR